MVTSNFREIGVRAVVQGTANYERDLKRMTTAENRHVSQLQRTSTSAAAAAGQIARLAGAFGIGLGAAGLLRVVQTSLGIFASFEQSLARTGAISGATAEQMEEMTRIAREMGRTTVFTATEAADALTFLAQAGFSVEESTAALPGVLQIAAAAQIDLATAADLTSNVLSGYGLRVTEIGRVNDVLAKAFTSANTNLLQLGQALEYAGPVASAAGLRFEETSAALALMGNAGIQSTTAGTALRGALTRLLNPSNQAQAILDELGVTVTDTGGNMLPLVDIIAQLERSGLSASDAMTIFGQRAGPAMLALVSQGSQALRDLTTTLDESGGTAQGIAEKQMDTLQGSIKELQSAASDLAIVLGTELSPGLRDIAKDLSDLARFISDNQEAVDLISAFISGLTRQLTIQLQVIRELHGIYSDSLTPAMEGTEEQIRSMSAATGDSVQRQAELAELLGVDLFEGANDVSDTLENRLNPALDDLAEVDLEGIEQQNEVLLDLEKILRDLERDYSRVRRDVQRQIRDFTTLASITEGGNQILALYRDGVLTLAQAQELLNARIESNMDLAEEQQRINDKVSESWERVEDAVKDASDQFRIAGIDMVAAVRAISFETNLSADQISEALQDQSIAIDDVRGALQAYGLSLEETIKILDALENQAEDATQALRDQGRELARSGLGPGSTAVASPGQVRSLFNSLRNVALNEGLLGLPIDLETLNEVIQEFIDSGLGVTPAISAAMRDVIRLIEQWADDVRGGLDPSTLPAFAHGGAMQHSGQAIVGERGAEMLSLPAGAFVRPIQSVDRSFTATVNANYSNPQQPASIGRDLEAILLMAGI